VNKSRDVFNGSPPIACVLGKKNPASVKALQLGLSNWLESQHNSGDGSYFHTARVGEAGL